MKNIQDLKISADYADSPCYESAELAKVRFSYLSEKKF